MQSVIDAIIIIGMFVLRIGVPLALTIAVGYWLEKKLRPQETSVAQPDVDGRRIIPFRNPRTAIGSASGPGQVAGAQCWEAKNCAPAVRSECAAFKQPNLPCWLALQASGGNVREECFACDFYKSKRAMG